MAAIFGHAPLVHALTLVTVVQSVTGMQGAGSSAFSLQNVLQGNYACLFLPFFTFTSNVQVAVGAILLYKLRELEQRFGSKKFGTFVFLTYVLAILLHVALAVVSQQMQISELKTVASGPYFLIFAMLAVFHKSIPALSPSQYSFLGLGISEKSWTYLIAAQLMFNSGLASAIPSVVGLIAGMFYISNQMNIQSWRLPSLVEKIVTLPFAILGVTPAAPSSQQVEEEEDMEPNARDDRERQPSFADATTERLGEFGGLGEAIEPPTEEQIATITNLGFPRAKAIHALERTDNNVEQAANYILGGGD